MGKMNERCGGIDVGKRFLLCCLLTGAAHTFAHQKSFGGGVADDDFPYSGNDAAIAENWLALVTGWSAKWEVNANLDLGSLISAIEKAIQDAGPIISAVIAVAAA